MSDTQRDREDRQHVIEVLKNMLDWMGAIDYIVATPERIHALAYAIASIKTDLKYDLMYEEALEQESTTKNDLGVDLISREQAKTAIRDKFKDLPSRVEINTILNELPSVTPQEPKSEWEHDHEILKAYSDGQASIITVLEAIKAEIEQSRYGLINDGLDVALKIIDKHISEMGDMAEIEPQESEET